MVLLEPEQRIRQQEVADFVPAVVENERAPVGLFTLTRVGMLVERRPVEARETVRVPFSVITSGKLLLTDALIKATKPLSTDGADVISVER